MNEHWLARWRDGRIAFHEGRPNALLERHVERLAGCRRILVPLCGKAEDLAFLAARGHDVVGVELAELAVRSFFAEHQLAPAIAPRGPFVAYQVDALSGRGGAGDTDGAAGAGDAGGGGVGGSSGDAGGSGGGGGGSITLLVGDFFALTPELIGPIDAVYDRAALIALPAELRPGYVARLRSAVPAGAPALVITLEYDQRAMAGPPFAVLEAELRALYAGATIELLEQRPDIGGKCSQSGVAATERCFAIGAGNARS